MTKIKVTYSRENSKMEIQNVKGGIVKAKQLKGVTGGKLGLADKKKFSFEATPLPTKCIPKNMSTPWASTGQPQPIGHDWFNGSSASRTPFSPILFKEDNVRCGENENLSPSKTLQTSKGSEKGNAKKIVGSRRTSGKRRLFSISEGIDEIHPSEVTDKQLKVKLRRTPLKSNNIGKENTFNKMPSCDDSDVQAYHTIENSLFRNLKNDWSSSALCETLLESPQPSSPKEAFVKQLQSQVRRDIPPVFELTGEQPSNDRKSTSDEDYSSSEEFEKADGKRNSHLKKAPTWNSLHRTVMGQKNTSGISFHQLRRMDGLIDVRPVVDDDSTLQSNVPKLNSNLTKFAEEIIASPVKGGKEGRPSISEDVGKNIDKSQTTVRPKLPRVKLQRLRLNLEQLQTANKENVSKRKDMDRSSSSVFTIQMSSGENDAHTAEPESNDAASLCDTTSVDNNRQPLSKIRNENNLPIPATTEGEEQKPPLAAKLLRIRLRKFRFDSKPLSKIRNENNLPIPATTEGEEQKPPLAAKLLRIRLRKFRFDSKLIQPVSEITTSKSQFSPVEDRRCSRVIGQLQTEQTVQGIPSDGNVGLGNLESDPKANKVLERHAKKRQKADNTCVENNVLSRLTEEIVTEPQELCDHQTAKINMLNNQEPEENVEQIFDEDLQVLQCPANKPNNIELRPNSPVYDILENDMSTNSIWANRKFFTSRIYAAPVAEKPIKKTHIRSPVKRKSNNDNIYDFCLQSSPEEMIPVDDIIREMVKTGKAVVAKQKRKRGGTKVETNKLKNKKVKKIDKKKQIRPKNTDQPQQKKQALPTGVLEETNVPENTAPPANHLKDQSTFSVLARSTMINQAKANHKIPKRKMITDRRTLLSMAKKIVGQSTPVQPAAAITNVPQLSPIYRDKSPWRVTDEDLARTFYFGRNTANLPSFSSDYFPQTQTENRPQSVSSFSSNDSNMENIDPSGVGENLQIDTQSVPRRGPSNRSPLKLINIIDVVNLPPLVFDNTAKETEKFERSISSSVNKSASRLNETLPNVTNSNETIPNEAGTNKVDLFGFEEIIDEKDSPESSLIINAIPAKDNLKEKLHRLKRLKPDVPSAKPARLEHIKDVYDGPKMRQKSLRQMLCSTMIEKPNTVEQDVFREERDNDDCNSDTSNLFKDLDAETTFNQSDSRRTYSRLYKTRRRKIRHNFVMFKDSDSSEDDDEQSFETRPKKRHKTDPKTKVKELNKFVNEFNEMCKEVSQYQLIVE